MPPDLAAAKLVAGRDKDLTFLRVLLKELMVDVPTLQERITTLPVPTERLVGLRDLLEHLVSTVSRPWTYNGS